jgi:hypothetical protein
MSDFEKIKMFEHARKKLYEGTLSENDFRVIVDECSKSPFEIITQKIKKMGDAAIKELKLKIQRTEKGLPPYPEFCDFDKATMDVLD